MANFKIFKEHRLVVVKHSSSPYITSNYLANSFVELVSHKDYSPEYNFLFDNKNFHWNKVSPFDVSKIVEYRNLEFRRNIVHAACVVKNIGQIAYAEVIFDNIPMIEAEYFLTLEEACNYLCVPTNVVDF